MRRFNTSMLVGLALVLGGCTITKTHTAALDNLVIDNDQAMFTVSRVVSRVVQGADMHATTPLAARAEYYVVPLDPSMATNQIAPGMTFDTLGWIAKDSYYPRPAKLIVNPVTKVLMPYLDLAGRINADVIPSNREQALLPVGSGRDGYAYASDETHRLTYVPHQGEACTVDLLADLTHVSWMNGIHTLLVSNDGRLVAVARKQDDGYEVNIYEGCRKVARQTLSSNRRLIGFCSSHQTYMYVLDDRIKNDVEARSADDQFVYTLPGAVHWPPNLGVPHWPPVFDCVTKRFFWLGSEKETAAYAAIDLHQYDPVTKEKLVSHLRLGAPLD